jgi:hypothetical protein
MTGVHFAMDNVTFGGNVASPVSITPTSSGAFVNGSWTGNITVLQLITGVTLRADDGTGHVGSSNPFGVVSTNMPPVITLQPTNQTVLAGQTTMFSAGASGTSPLSYQWMSNQVNIAGATNTSLILPDVQPGQAGIYAVRVTNLYGSTLSSNALLTVIPPATNCITAFPGLVSWWPAEGNAEDAVGANNGTLVGGVSYAGGEVGRAFQLDGTSGYVSIPASSSLNIGTGSGVTIEGWINPNNPTQKGMPLVEWDYGGADGLQLWISALAGGGDLYADVKDSTGVHHQIYSANGLISNGVFQHVALTYDKGSGVALLYINGVQVASTNFGNITPQTTYPCYLGLRTYTAEKYGGLLDEISLYNRALSSNEMALIYQAGINGKCPPDPLTIWSQPHHRAVLLGCYALFEVLAEGSGPLTYQWSKDGFAMNLQTNYTLLLTNVQTPDFGNYNVVVSDAFGSVTSSPALLSLGHPPVAHPDVIQRFAAGGVRIDAFSLVTNDTDADGDFLTVTAVSTNSTAGGVVGLTNNWIYYAPPAGGGSNDTFTYIVDDGGCGTDVGTVTVQIKPDNLQPLNLGADNLNNGSALVRFDGMPGSTYHVLYSDSLTPPNWKTLTSLTADSFGVCQFVDWSPTNAPSRFYRAVQP